MRHVTSLRLVGVMAGLFLIGCASTSPFVGTWQPADPASTNREILTLDKKGQVFGTETPPDGRAYDFTGAWEAVATNRAAITVLSPPPSMRWQATILDDNQMRIIGPDRVVNLRKLP